MLLILVSILIGLLFFLFIFNLINSPGKIEPGKPIQGSISEKTVVPIGGFKQGMFMGNYNSSGRTIVERSL
jgi:hypothetical protein